MIDVKAKISSFFIFNSSFGPREGEELQRILYFYPSQTSADSQKMQVGLCEAVIKFMSTFSQKPCEALRTQTKKIHFLSTRKRILDGSGCQNSIHNKSDVSYWRE